MILQRTATHSLSGLGALALIAGAVAGCAPTPAPTPTPTAAFASEEEAFAKAEEVYRAYNETNNAARTGATDEDPQDFLTGSALEGFLDSKDYLQSNGLAVNGPTLVTKFLAISSSVQSDQLVVVANVCLDVSSVHLIDSAGQDVTPTSRSVLLAQQVELTQVGKSFQVSREAEGDVSTCA